MATRRQAITMRDVANAVGVSKQTVSAVINGSPLITDETRGRVLAACEQLGYHVDFVARSLATGRTRTVALLVSDTSSPFIGRLVVAAEDYAHSCGYSLVLHATHDDPERESAYFMAAVQRGVDGVVFISATDRPTDLERLQRAGIPYVAIDRVPDPYTGPAVTLDNAKVGHLAAEYLLGLGHRRIAHISGPQNVRMARERLRGFREPLETRGLGADLRVELVLNWDYDAGYHAMQRILDNGPRPTAVFAAGDVLAIGAMRAIREAGLSVPADISIIGVDDIDSAAYLNPPLTTIRQSISELATLGFQLLFDILNDTPSAQTTIVMDPVLIVRGSTGPASTRPGEGS
jgi:DNA-binding LacI/PurR family transcriptional regulator